MSSAARRLRRIAERAKLTPAKLSPEAAKHGCEICRAIPWRKRAFTEVLALLGPSLGTARLRCTTCGLDWKVEIFAVGENQELHISFECSTDRGASN